MNSRLLLAGVLVIAVAALGGVRLVQITGFSASVAGSQDVDVVIDNGQSSSTYSIVLNPGETAFDALKRVAIVDYEMREPSVLIREINGIKQDQDHYWEYLVNEKTPQARCDDYYPAAGDVVKFRYVNAG